MTIREHVDTSPAAADLTHRQRRLVRRAALPALVMAILGPIAVTFVSGQPSVPDDNLDGNLYLGYALAHRTGEVQSLIFMVTVLAVAAFVVALSVVYAQRAGRPTFPTVVMTGGAAAFVGLQFIAASCNLTITLLGHGYPSFGADRSAQLITTALWDLTNVVVTAGYLPFVAVICAAIAANRADPIVPRLLAGPIAGVVAGFAGVVLIVTLFVDTGAFTPMSSGSGTATAAPISLWLAAVAVAVLWRTRSARRT
jgi:hypothetical protein